jgi:hypothetical protein
MLNLIQSPSPVKLNGNSVQGLETPNSDVKDNAGDQTPRPKFDTQDDSTSTAAGSSSFLSGAQVPAFPCLKSLHIHDAGHRLHETQQEVVKHVDMMKTLNRSQSPFSERARNIELVGSLEPAAKAKSEASLGAAETKIEQEVIVDEQCQRESQKAETRANVGHNESVSPGKRTAHIAESVEKERSRLQQLAAAEFENTRKGLEVLNKNQDNASQ